jgi:prevent-host-death family protein
MTTVTITSFREKCGDYFNQVVYGGERITISKHGKCAVMVSAEDAKLLEMLEDKIDLALAKKVLASKEKTITLEELKEKLGIK